VLIDKGRWGVPRNGMVFEKRDGALVLVSRATFEDRPDVSIVTESEWTVYQIGQFTETKHYFGIAGIPVIDESGLING
jgi:hypothetical protein